MPPIVQQLEIYGLGLIRNGQVIVQKHNPLWSEAFSLEIKRIKENVCNDDFFFHHIGSSLDFGNY